MKRENYIDENPVPTEDDFSPRKVDEKLELRKSIKRGCRTWIIITFITALIFAIIGTIYLVNYSYFLGAIIMVVAFYWGYLAYVYYRIQHASTAKEMLHHLDKLLFGNYFIDDTTLVRALAIGGIAAGLILDMGYNLHWVVTLLVYIVIVFLIVVLFCSCLKYETGSYPQDDKIDKKIEKLLDLEEK